MERDWRVKWPIFPFFERGKDLDVRVKNGYPERLREGDVLFINERLRRVVIAVRSYPDFKTMLSREDCRRIHPGKSSAELLEILRKMYPAHLERKGVLVFELSTT